MTDRRTPTLDRLVAALLAVVVAVAASVALAPAASAGTVEDEGRLYELHNQARAQAGLSPLAYDPAAVGVARSWAQELARSGRLRHNPDLAAAVNAHVTTSWTRLAENVGYAGTPEQLHDAYMASSAHRANILGDFNRVGVGAARSSDGRLWTTVVFLKGPALAAPSTTVPATTFAPFPSAQAFAAQQFVDLLGRPADAGGLSTWSNALASGATTPAGMVASLVDSAEAQMLVEPVNRLYRAYFRRSPDAAGMAHWVGRLRGGASLGQVSAAFADSPEFRGTYGSLADAAFVDLVYRNVLGRAADATGLAYWLAQLAGRALDRGGVMVNFSESAEYRVGTRWWNDVVQVYVGLLRRAPDQASLDLWTGRLRSGTPLADLARTVLASQEYANRF